MEYPRGWRAMREDPQWMGKVGVGTLIVLSGMCIPVVGQIALVGFTTLILRRAVSGLDSPMPRLDLDFDYLSKLLNVGFKGFLARLLWSLPMIVIAMGSFCCMYIAMGGAAVIGAAGASSGSDIGAGLGGLGMVCVMLGAFTLYFVTIFAIALPMQIAIMRAELADDVNAAMRFKEVMTMTRMLLKELIVGHLVMSLVGMVVAFFGIITLYLLLFPGIVVITVIQTYYHAELYKAYLQKGGQPLPIGPLDVEGGELAQPRQAPGGYPPGPPPPQF